VKNINKIIFISAITFIFSGCNQYFVSTSPQNTYYGAYNRRDFTHADVKLFKKDSKLICDGSIYLNSPSRSITMKNEKTDAKMKLGCNDGTILDITWQLNKGSFKDGTGEGVDQFNNSYKFSTISKGEFKKIAEDKVKISFPSDHKKSYLRY